MTTVSYSLNEGDPWEKIEINLSVKHLVQRLDKAYDGYEKAPDGFTSIHHCEALPGLLFHAIRLPDGRKWDSCNGWR